MGLRFIKKEKIHYINYLQRRPKECDSLFLSFCIRDKAPLFFSRIVTPVGNPTPEKENCVRLKTCEILTKRINKYK